MAIQHLVLEIMLLDLLMLQGLLPMSPLIRHCWLLERGYYSRLQVQNLDELVTVKANVLMDSASQRTFMTEYLAKKLRLKPEGNELLSVSTFGAGKAVGMDTYTVRFGVKLNDQSCMLMC